jgi:hypothetical protein
MLVNLDLLLYGHPTKEQIVAEFHNEFLEEYHLVAAIKKHLMSEADKQIIEQNHSSIEDMLNGRVRGDTAWQEQMYGRWNTFLGFRCFGF